ncbi:MAG: hypothetical protein ACHQUC_01295 [Chlamydiales bacterium]
MIPESTRKRIESDAEPEWLKKMSEPSISRKVSSEKTDECPIWSEWDQIWMESDEQLRKRIKSILKGEI